MNELIRTFVSESRDQLLAMEDGLLRLEQDPQDSEQLAAIFRAAHTIKGGSGVVECPFIEAFAHRVENVLDRLRKGEIPLSGELSSVLLACGDHIGTLLDVFSAGLAQPETKIRARGEELIETLDRQFSGDCAEVDGAAIDPQGMPSAASAAACDSSEASGTLADAWHISVRFGRNVFRSGVDPLALLDYLASFGEIASLVTLADSMPSADLMDPECCYLGFEIAFRTRVSKAQIEEVFEFVLDDCTLRILPPHSKISDYLRLIEELPEDNMHLGEILVRSGALTKAELDEGLALQRHGVVDEAVPEAAPRVRIGTVLIGQKMVHREVVEAAASRQGAVREKNALEARTIRVQAAKLDQLIDQVGEMVIAGAGSNLLAQRSGMAELIESTSLLLRLVEDIRDSALQLRMVEIGDTFSRFKRVVRDAAREMGKAIELVITGSDTELDKSVVEKLGDPLMHLVRNAIDHGIEPAEVRKACGKPESGTVQLNAYHDSGSIVIEVIDDGAGLSRERIRAKAVEQGLVDPAATLSDHEIHNLIFEPGFSTAAQVTNISGRGVGMDVVRRNIQSLRGSVEVGTVDGAGTTFTIRLPLTLAIIDGFLTGVGKRFYVVPLDSIIECIELPRAQSQRNYLNLRGEVLPFVRLRELFAVPGELPARQSVVIVQHAGRKAGLVVDTLLGEFQTVIKPLGALFQHLQGVGGSTILGTGEVALILDVPALAGMVTSLEDRNLNTMRNRQAIVSC